MYRQLHIVPIYHYMLCLQTCQPSRFWRDSPAFLPDVLRPAKSWKCPAFCTKSDFLGARAICNAAAVPDVKLMQITQLNVITEIPFDFSQKYQTVPRPNRRATVNFGTQLISVGCILLNKISMWALPTVPLCAGKSRFFTRNVPPKTFSRLAGLCLVLMGLRGVCGAGAAGCLWVGDCSTVVAPRWIWSCHVWKHC